MVFSTDIFQNILDFKCYLCGMGENVGKKLKKYWENYFKKRYISNTFPVDHKDKYTTYFRKTYKSFLIEMEIEIDSSLFETKIIT